MGGVGVGRRGKVEVGWREGELAENESVGEWSAGVAAVETLDAFVGGCR